MANPIVRVKKLRPTATLPVYAKPGDAGADLVFAPADGKPYRLADGVTAMLETGISIELPEGWEAQVRSRSGLASKGVFVANSPGTIDTGYRGEIKVLLHKLTNSSSHVSSKPIIIHPGDRIAQIVIAPCHEAGFVEAEELSDSVRGETGFGSSGR